MKLSIIIPVYNVKGTLERCVDSVLAQKYHDYQLILVNDGSTDGSQDICNKYMEQEHRIQVIHKENGGLSDARNAGLDKAKGEYITFIDSDDTLAPDTIGKLMEILGIHHEYDLLEYPAWIKYDSSKQHMLQLKNRQYDDMKEYWLKAKAYEHTFACNKIYKRELFEDVRYPKGKKFEDVLILPQLLKRCNTIATTNVGLYYYYYNSNSITEKADGNALKDLLEAHMNVINEINDAEYYAHVLNIQMDVYEKTGESPILPTLTYNTTLKLKILHLNEKKKLCRLNKLMHKIYRRSL